MACVVAAVSSAPHARPGLDPDAPLTFGILPIGGPAESLETWRPLLDDLHAALARARCVPFP